MSSQQVAGALSVDRTGIYPIQFPAKAAYQDGAASPIVSPKTGISTAQAFTPPAGAIAMIFQASGACRYGDNATLDGTGTGKGYKKGGALTDTSIPCANGATIYIAAETSTIDVDFMYEMLN